MATNEDAVRSVARFKGYKGAATTAAELRYLKDIGVSVPRKVARHPLRPLTKGDAANMFLNAMQDAAERRGLLGRFFTGSRRFAARDAMAQKLLPNDSLSNEFMSGGELMAMLGRAVEQMGKKQ